MSTCSLGTHLSLSPMSAQPSKKGRDHDGHAPSASTVCHSAPTRGGLRRSLLRPAYRSCHRWPCRVRPALGILCLIMASRTVKPFSRRSLTTASLRSRLGAVSTARAVSPHWSISRAVASRALKRRNSERDGAPTGAHFSYRASAPMWTCPYPVRPKLPS